MKKEKTKVVLPIKPKFAEAIFNGEKKIEFRKNIFNHNVTKVIVYASSPISKIIGEFQIDEIIKDDIDNLWKNTKNESGTTKESFLKYFKNNKDGYAIKIYKPIKYKTYKSFKELYGFTAPRNFIYI